MLVALIAAAAVGLGDFAAEARLQLESRIRKVLDDNRRTCSVTGAVTGVGDRSFFIQNGDDALKISSDLSSNPRPGDVVAVEGVPQLEGGRVLVDAQHWTKIGTAMLPEPIRATSEDLVSAGTVGTGRHGINWMRVEIVGRAIERTERGFAIETDGVPVTVIASQVPAFVEGCGRTRPRLRVRGVAELVLDQSVLFGRVPYVMGVRMQVNGAEDIDLIPDALYLANVRDRRMMAAVAGTIVLLVLGVVVFAVVVVRQRRRNFRAQTLMAERKRMADDIHDTIEQHLVGAGMLIQLNRNKEARDILLRAKSELRDVIWGLKNDDMMRLTPAAMLKGLADDETAKGLVRVVAKTDGLPAALSAQAMRDVLLIVREAIGNAVKHGGAGEVSITTASHPGGGWTLRIVNDGRPFDAANAPGAGDGHFGLEGMRERARRIGARMTIAVDGGRTVVTVEVGSREG